MIPRLIRPLLFCFLLLIFALPTPAELYSEDFHTTLYRDPAGTAEWDTAIGEIRLPGGSTMSQVGTVTANRSETVVVQGTVAYVADTANGLRIFDVSDPADPIQVGMATIGDGAWDVFVTGDLAYVAAHSEGLRIFDISDPTTPTPVGFASTPDHALGVTVDGDHAFVANRSDGVIIIDVSDPTAPVTVGSTTLSLHGRRVEIRGRYAYNAGGDFNVIDISDRTNPVQVATLNTPDLAQELRVRGDYAYIGDYNGGFTVVDISDPLVPQVTAHMSLPGPIFDVEIAGDRAYAVGRGTAPHLIDISDPTAPVLIATAGPVCVDAHGAELHGEYLYIADFLGDMLRVVDARELATPIQVATAIGGIPHDMVICGNRMYEIDRDTGLHILDISDPANAFELGNLAMANYPVDIVTDGHFVYTATRENGLQIIDVSDPSAPVFFASLDTPDYAYTIELFGSYVFLGNRTDGLYIIDISDPANPSYVSNEPSSYLGRDFDIAGDHVFMASGTFEVYDISDLSNPVLVHHESTPDYTQDIAVSGNYAYVPAETAGLLVFDISDPLAPILLSQTATTGAARRIRVDGGYAVLACMGAPLQVFDITDPANPLLAATGPVTNSPVGLELDGEYAFVGDFNYGVRVVRLFEENDDNLNTAANLTLSLPVASGLDIERARIVTSQVGTLDWELSADGGLNWQTFMPGTDWADLAFPGTQLLWRCTHLYQGDGVNPSCTALDIEYEENIDCSGDFPDMAEWNGRGWEYGGGPLWFESPNFAFDEVWSDTFESCVGQVETWNWQTNFHDRAIAIFDAGEMGSWDLENVVGDVSIVSSSGGYGNMNLYFCCQNPVDFFDGYGLQFTLRPDYKRIHLMKFSGGESVIINQVDAPLAYGEVYHVNIDMSERAIHIAGGTVDTNLDIPDTEFTGGTIGFGVSTAGLEHVVGAFDELVGQWRQPPILVAHLPLDDDAHDESGTGIDAVAHNGISFTDACAANLDGVDDFILYPYDSLHQPSQAFTLSCWIQFDNLNPDQALHQLINDSNYAPANGYYLALNDEGHAKLRIKGDTGEEALLSSLPLSGGEWHHLVGVFNGEVLRLYIDGDWEETDVISTVMSYQANHLRVGYHAENSDDFYRGLIDEVRVYDGALNEAEVLDLYTEGLSCKPLISIAGTILSDCDGPLSEVAMTLVDGDGAEYTTVSDSLGAYAFTDVPYSESTGFIAATPIAGYDFDTPSDGATSIPLDNDQALDFSLICLPGDIVVSVFTDCEGVSEAAFGIDVTAFSDLSGELVAEGMTDAAGLCILADLPAGDYAVSIATPLGYQSVDEELAIHVLGVTTPQADFSIECLETAYDPRSRCYWKHQVGRVIQNEARGWNLPVHYDGDNFLSLLETIYDHFAQHASYQVDVYDGSGACTRLDSLITLRRLLAARRLDCEDPTPWGVRLVKGHLTATLLNVSSGKLHQETIVSMDGATTGQAIWYGWQVADSDDYDSPWQAAYVLRRINFGRIVAADLIPLVTVPLWEQSPASPQFALRPNWPNPFNPRTKIELTLPELGEYQLGIFDISGRLVRRFDGLGGPGQVDIIWDGRDRQGASVASGVYFCRAQAGGNSAQIKMQLLK